jgi:spoIIIJ-associated protein
MREEVFEAKTIEGAILLVLDEWNCGRDEIEYQIIQEPAKGIFGQLRPAKIKVWKKDENATSQNAVLSEKEVKPEDYTKNFFKEIFKGMNIDEYSIDISQEENNILVRISSPYEGLLIGHHGKTLESLQYLLNRLAGVKGESNFHYIIDVGGYLEKHKMMLEKLAIKAAEKVKETRQDVQLKPLNAFERRIVHMKLREDQELKTYSVGEGKIKNLIITLRSQESGK